VMNKKEVHRALRHTFVSVKFSFIENICNVAGYDRLVLLKPSSISCGIIMY